MEAERREPIVCQKKAPENGYFTCAGDIDTSVFERAEHAGAAEKEMISLMPSGSMKPMLDIGQMVYMDQKIERYLAHGADYHIFISMIPTRRFTCPWGWGSSHL